MSLPVAVGSGGAELLGDLEVSPSRLGSVVVRRMVTAQTCRASVRTVGNRLVERLDHRLYLRNDGFAEPWLPDLRMHRDVRNQRDLDTRESQIRPGPARGPRPVSARQYARARGRSGPSGRPVRRQHRRRGGTDRRSRRRIGAGRGLARRAAGFGGRSATRCRGAHANDCRRSRPQDPRGRTVWPPANLRRRTTSR